MTLKVLFIAMLMAVMAVRAGECADNGIIEKAKSAVKRALKDPYSAMFRNVHVGKEDSHPVRGEVNAKNGCGAYIGYDKFFYKPKGNVVTFERQYAGNHDDEYYANYNRDVDRWNDQQKAEGRSEMKIYLINLRKTEDYKIMFVDGW